MVVNFSIGRGELIVDLLSYSEVECGSFYEFGFYGDFFFIYLGLIFEFFILGSKKRFWRGN